MKSIQDEAEKYNDQPDMIISDLIVCVMRWGHKWGKATC